MNYLNIKNAAKFLGVTTAKVKYLYSKNKFVNTETVDQQVMISEEDLSKYKKKMELLETMYYTISEASVLLEMSCYNLCRYAKKEFFKSVLKENNQYFVSKTEIHDLLEKNKDYYALKTDYKTCEETAAYLDRHVETVYRYIARGLFPHAITSSFHNAQWKIPNKDIELFMEKKPTEEKIKPAKKDKLPKEPKKKHRNYLYMFIDKEMEASHYTVQEVADYFGVSKDVIKFRIRNGVFKDVIKVSSKAYIGKEEVHSTPQEYIQKKLNPGATNEERIDFYLQKVNNSDALIETIETLKSYIKHVVSNSKRRDKNFLINDHCNMFINLSLQITKEVYLYNDMEIMGFIASTAVNKKPLIGFLNFVLATKSSKCKFRNKYTYTSKINRQGDAEVYSKKSFKAFYLYVNNTETHKERAILKQDYAESWFYVFMHMTNAWRSSDILHFPRVNFSEVSQDFINAVLNQGITIADAQAIVNIVSEQWESFVSNKKSVLNKFLVNIDSVQTAAVIFLILESHRRKQTVKDNDAYLLPFLQKRNGSISPFIEKFFEADPSLEKFSSRIANRSLMTYFFYSVSKGEKNGDVSHLLAQRLRRHISQDTVSLYVMNTNQDGELDDSSYNLFRRGHFGWLYNSLVEIVINKKDLKLSQEEKTKIIEAYQEIYSPSEIEEISSYFLKYQNMQKSVALEIALLSDEELTKRLYNIYMGEMPSKETDSQCFYSENCKNPTANCKTCPYIIPRIHLLISLREDLEETIEKMEKLNEHDIYERIRKTHILFKLLNLVSQAVKSFEKEYVNSFIPLKPLQNKLESIGNIIYLIESKGE